VIQFKISIGLGLSCTVFPEPKDKDENNLAIKAAIIERKFVSQKECVIKEGWIPDGFLKIRLW